VSKANKRERQRQNREQRREYEEKLAKRRRMWKTARTFAIIAVPIIVIGVVLSISNGGDSGSSGSSPTKLPAPKQTIDPNQAYSATIDTTKGKIELAIDAQQYPISANNFVYLANKKFYDGLDFVRAAKDFVIQTGSPDNTNVGGPGYTVQAEVPTASPAYPIGTVAWAKSGSDPAGSAGSQFFIVTGANGQTLPSDYAVIGHVTSGQDVADAIEALAPSSGDGPLTKKVTMKKVTIATKGIVPPSSTP
jgi:cyclophilin family peptidyl-prolyl cis-trans isomerase